MSDPVLSRLCLRAYRPDDPLWRPALQAHLMQLDPESRLNRFLVWSSDAAVQRYAAATRPTLILGAGCDGRLCGLAELHVGEGGDPVAEIALSVNDEDRRAGIGGALFTAVLHEGQRRGLRNIWIHFLRTNTAIRRISDRAGFISLPDRDPGVVTAHIAA
jgi:GNAT superfamily N-acetyltransferase